MKFDLRNAMVTPRANDTLLGCFVGRYAKALALQFSVSPNLLISLLCDDVPSPQKWCI